jgi:hypothetical protein
MTERVRDLLWDKRHRSLQHGTKPKRFAVFRNGHLYVGTESLHRTASARKFRLQLRLIRQHAAARSSPTS